MGMVEENCGLKCSQGMYRKNEIQKARMHFISFVFIVALRYENSMKD